MSFCEQMANITYTENSALTHKSTESSLLDWFFHGAALRNELDTERILRLFQNALIDNPIHALRVLFYIRDVRGGQGERRVFRICFNWLAEEQTSWVMENLHLVPEYGRWDDLLPLLKLGKELRIAVCKFLEQQLNYDAKQMLASKPCSLLAKWMPSQNTSSKLSRQYASIYMNTVGVPPRDYRKQLVALRKYIDIVEAKLSAKQVSTINYANVPSKAAMLYRNAFMKHDTERYKAYIEAVNSNKAQINASTVYPYEIIEKLMNQSDSTAINTLEALWKNLPDYVPGLCGLVVADTSGSMCGRPMAVSISLAMYIAERNKNTAWKDYFISFTDVPKFHRIKGTTLKDRMASVDLGDIANTNLQAVFQLILNRATSNYIPEEDMPQLLLIISDMEFDEATTHNTSTNFEEIRRKYQHAGYKLPTLVFWNVNSRHNHTPITINDNGVILLSGCSPVVFKYALDRTLNPMDMVFNITNSNRYKGINCSFTYGLST